MHEERIADIRSLAGDPANLEIVCGHHGGWLLKQVPAEVKGSKEYDNAWHRRANRSHWPVFVDQDIPWLCDQVDGIAPPPPAPAPPVVESEEESESDG